MIGFFSERRSLVARRVHSDQEQGVHQGLTALAAVASLLTLAAAVLAVSRVTLGW